MADERDHPIAELLAAPVRAIQEAQIAAEREFVAFFVEYGLEEVVRRDKKGERTALRVREVEFEMRRSVTDPSDPGTAIDRTAIVSAPLLSLVNLPTVAIEEATVNLSLDVSARSADAPSRSKLEKAEVADAAALRAAIQRDLLPRTRRPVVELVGSVGNRGVSASFSAKGKIDIALKLVGTGGQETVRRLTALLDENLSARIEDER